MKCFNCNFEIQEDFTYCPNCGAAAQQQTYTPNPAATMVFGALRDKLFLTICILLTVSCVLSLSNGIPIISLLATIFLWIVFSKSRKGIIDTENLRSLSGTVYAGYVINNVLFIMFLIIGIILALAFGYISSSPYLLEEFANEFELPIFENEYSPFADILLSVSGWIILFFFLFISVTGILINVLGMKKIHRFVKSVYQGIQTYNPVFNKVKAAKNWLLFFGICSAITALSSLFSLSVLTAFAEGCNATVMIIASVLINKHFLSVNYIN